MFDIAFDTKLTDKDKKKTALNNIIYLSRDEAGAERIFQEGGLVALKGPGRTLNLTLIATSKLM